MKKPIKITIIIVLILAAVGSGVYYYFSSKIQLNNDYAVGNTAGNLNNGGKFCEYDGKIYFSNPYDSGHLYVMNSDCTKAQALNADTVSSLNVCGNYIYYVRNNFSRTTIATGTRAQLFGVYRTNLSGEEAQMLYQTKSGIASLHGNYLYYQHYTDEEGMTFYKIKIDGKEETKLSDKVYNPASILNGKMYFTDTYNNNRISTMDLNTNSISAFYTAGSYLVDAAADYIYYIDLDKNYALVSLNTSSKTLEQLFSASDAKVINYNRYGSKIFFQLEGGEQPGLYRINTDGTQLEFIAAGNIASIHCTSQYTFFQYYEDKISLYRVPTTGVITTVDEIQIK